MTHRDFNLRHPPFAPRRLRSQRGQALYLIISFLVVLMAFASIGVDVSMLWGTQLRMQTAADAASLAGTSSLTSGGSGNVTTSALASASKNGFTNAQGTTGDPNLVSITVNNPPKSGGYTSQSLAVEVIIQQAQPTFFMRVAGFSTVSVAARSVSLPNSGRGCIYALNSSSTGALQVNGNGQLNAACGVLVNSGSSSAISSDSNGNVGSTYTGCVGGNHGATCTPHEVWGIASFPDPLASQVSPTVSGSGCTTVKFDGSGNANLSSGSYYCATTVGSGKTVNLSPGVVGFASLNIKSGSHVNGTGACIYLKTGSVTMSSGAAANLSAPTSGTYQGILMFQDRANSSAATLSSGAGVTMTGSLYFPAAALTLNSSGSGSGSGYANQYSLVIADKVIVSNGATLNINNDYSNLASGSPIKQSVTVE